MLKNYKNILFIAIAVFVVFAVGIMLMPKREMVVEQSKNEEQKQMQIKSEEEKKIIDNREEEIKNKRKIAASYSEELTYLENGEIDTSDWATYHNDFTGLSIKYPPFLYVAEVPGTHNFTFDRPNDENWDKNWHMLSHLKYTDDPDNHLFYNKSFEERKKIIKDSYKPYIPDEYYYDFVEIDNENKEDTAIYYRAVDLRKLNNYYGFSSQIIYRDKWIIGLSASLDNSNIENEEVIQEEIENEKYGKVIKQMLKTVVFN